MAIVLCSMTDCKYRSKRASKKYKYKNGEKCYGCTRETILVGEIFDPDNYVVDVVGKENMAQCEFYEPLNQILAEVVKCWYCL